MSIRIRCSKTSRECRPSLLFHPPLRQGGDLRLLAAFPWQNRGHDVCISTRNPFLNLWVKAQIHAHPRISTGLRRHALPTSILYACRKGMSRDSGEVPQANYRPNFSSRISAHAPKRRGMRLTPMPLLTAKRKPPKTCMPRAASWRKLYSKPME